MESVDVALLVVRLWLAAVMVLHGLNHGRNLEGTASWFQSVGFSSPRLNAQISSAGEVAIGLAIGAGFLTTLGAAGMTAMMFVAFWTIHRFAGFFNFHRPDEGYEYVATLAVVALAIAIIGPGDYSIDQAMGLANELNGVSGALIWTAGLIAGFVQTLIFWKRPKGKIRNDVS